MKRLFLLMVMLWVITPMAHAQTPTKYICVSPSVCTLITDAFPLVDGAGAPAPQPTHCSLYRTTEAAPVAPKIYLLRVAVVPGPTADPANPPGTVACQFTASYPAGVYRVEVASVLNNVESVHSTPEFVFESVAQPKPVTPMNPRFKAGTKTLP
jgi:hypothetical protein